MLLPRDLYLGVNEKSQRKVFLTDRLRATHMHILGRTGTGKTSHIEHMIRDDILKRRGVCVIDMLGNLYPKLLRYCVHRNCADRLILFDPSEPEYCPGLNYLETFGQLDTGVVVEKVMDGILRIYKQQDEAARPRWETYAPLTFTPLVEHGLTLLEVLPFVAPHITALRKKLLSSDSDFQLKEGWRLFDSLPRTADKLGLIEVIYNRGMRFWATKTIRRIVGQGRNFVNWANAMDEGKIILCNLGASANVSRKLADMLGVILLHQIIETAQLRRGTTLRPFYVYIDEFGRIVCKDFEFALDSLRQFGVSFVLANQRLGQLQKDIQSEDVYSAVMANTLCKLVFNVWHQDAEVMVKEIFAQQIHGDDVKYQGSHTLLVPRQELIELKSESSTYSSGNSQSDPGHSYSTGIVYDIDRQPSQESQSDTYSMPGMVTSSTQTDAHTTHEAFKTEYDRESEDDAPTFYSIEEKINHYSRLVMAQRQRESKLLIPGHNPISLKTPYVRDFRVRPEQIATLKQLVYNRNNCLTPAAVDTLIDERMHMLLGEQYVSFREHIDARALESRNAADSEAESRWE